MKVVKRDGRKQDFDINKIINAVNKAFIAVDGKEKILNLSKAHEIADRVEAHINKLNLVEIEIEFLQNIIEDKLMASHRKDVAKAYILYREERSKNRMSRTNTIKQVEEKLLAKNVENHNANLDEYSFGGRMGQARDAIMKQYALDYIISDMAKNNHFNNMIYIHDLDSYAAGLHNCMSIPFDHLLANGFKTRQTDIRPANSVNTAFQLLAVLFQLQSLQQFGGVSATHIDHTMVPYVRKSFRKHYLEGMKYIKKTIDVTFKVDAEQMSILDYGDPEINDVVEYAMDKTKKELKQAAEGMYHNLNTLQSRSGNQLPFSSINYGTCTLPEGQMVVEALLNGSIAGVGKYNRTSVFPCGIFQIMSGVNKEPGTPNYHLFQLALKSTSQRLYPNYCNVDWSGNEGYDINDPKTYMSTMGCRTVNGKDINVEPGTNAQTKDGRGNICPVTIIMPTLAMEAGRDVETFMTLLDIKINEAKDMLIERYKHICSQSPLSAKFMYENDIMLGYDGKTIESAMKHGTLVIGQIALAETLQLLIGTDHTTEDGMNLAKRIEQLFKTRCAEFKEKYKLNFGVYYTPAENMCHTSMKKFIEKYGIIKNVSDKSYFTNSMHVPVWRELSPFDKIDIESELTGYSNAGCITYVELDSTVLNNLKALEDLVIYAMDKDIPYFAINVPNDLCLECQYCGEFNDECPMCGSNKIERLRRVTGYLTGDYKSAFNKGKQEETEMRYKHSKKWEVSNEQN